MLTEQNPATTETHGTKNAWNRSNQEPTMISCRPRRRRILSTYSVEFPRRQKSSTSHGAVEFFFDDADVGKNATRRRVSRITLASVVNASSRRTTPGTNELRESVTARRTRRSWRANLLNIPANMERSCAAPSACFVTTLFS